MRDDVEKLGLGFQHHIAHLDGAGENDDGIFLVMDAGDKFLADENRWLAVMRAFAGAVQRQKDLACFSSRQRHWESQGWEIGFGRWCPGSKINVLPPPGQSSSS